jgi:transcriptional regulator with XRE-family HTH domain
LGQVVEKMIRKNSLIGDLKSRRQARGWSVKELSDRCGIDETFLSDWESGLGSPRFDEIEHWAAALGLAIELVPAESESRHGLMVDWDKRCAKVDGTPIRLTPMEWKALERLARTPGELVTHQALFHHLYGDDRHHRAQSTAVRVLITKLRRLLPIRIEAQWGQGYVISGLAPSQPQGDIDKGAGSNGAGSNGAGSNGAGGNGSGNGAGNGGVKPQPVIAQASCDRVSLVPRTVLRNPTPTGRELVTLAEPAMRRVINAQIRVGPRRAEELGVIERFLSERGVTRCPDVATIQQSPLPTLIWDKVKRKWIRPSMTGSQAS